MTHAETTQGARRQRRRAEKKLADAERALLSHVHESTGRTVELMAACAAAEAEVKEAGGSR